jgi:Glycosyltransferase family 87
VRRRLQAVPLVSVARAAALVLAVLALSPTAARAEQSQAVHPSDQLTSPASQTTPPRDHTLNAREAIQIASGSGKLQAELARHHTYRTQAFARGPGRWQVSYYDGDKEVAQVIVDERRRRAVEVWTGPQVAWEMARGLPGAFGRKVNAPYVWIPLMLAFIVPFVDWRRPLRLLHLDLAMLLAFSLSQLYFNRGEISTSVPLVYPVLGYLLARMLLLAFVRRFREPGTPFRPLVPVAYLAMAVIFLAGFRIGLNLTSSNVIDVGYSGVIGADRITHGEGVYDNFPADDESGDTYGPVTYYAYVPFELVLPWSGSWDELPAAHAAAIFFDLGTMFGLFLVGRRLRRGSRGTELGVMLAYAWAAYPYTVFALNSNANDSLVAMLLTYCFLFAQSSRLRGAFLAFAGAAKFAPLALVPLFLGYSRRPRTRLRFAVTFGLVLAIVTLPLVAGSGIGSFWDRTVGFQLGRESPFSIWGQRDGLRWLQDVVKALVVVLAVAVAFVPRRKTPIQLAALGAAVLIAVELSLTHWFYLYIVWFVPFVLIALLASERPPGESLRSGGGHHHELDRAGEPALV